MVNCSAYDCKSRSEKKEPGISFHSFPKDVEKCKMWLDNMKLDKWEPTKFSRICSKHFEERYLYRSQTESRVRLLKGAIPTIFPELPKHLQLKKTVKRARSISPEPGPSTMQPKMQPQTTESPQRKKLRIQLSKVASKSKEKTRKIRILTQSLKRYKRKVISLKNIIQTLQRKNLLLDEQAAILQNMPLINREMLQKRSSAGKKYSPELRKFAISLNFFSPKAYNYVRNVFNTSLPHPSTIGKWLQNINAAPGFTAEAFNTLQGKVNISDQPCICALIIDEMSIRKHLEWDGKDFHGYVNCGTEINDDRNELAKEAFVLLLSCINGTWKLPVGYFLTNGLNGQQKHSIVMQCIMLVEKTGARVVSLTCDGAPSNISMANLLGCSFVFPNIQTKFGDNSNSKYFFLDPCHMVKLVRNAFGEKKIFVDEDGNIINWRYVEALEQLQENEGLHLGNKLRKSHIDFFKQKMKVRLAVQLLSESVADSLEYCEQKVGLEEFKGCSGTVKFLRTLNNIFDILNSRSLAPPGFKKALCEKNIGKTTEFIDFAINYLSKLTFANKHLIIESQRKTGFIGLIVCLKSALQLFSDLVAKEKLLIYLPLYKVSQDHLELFFSSVRSKGGWNNNPTARQFMGAYKRLLVRGEVREHGVGNCIPLDQIPVLVSSSRISSKNPEQNINLSLPGFKENETIEEEIYTTWKDHDYIINDIVLSDISEQVVIYISGFVTHHLQKVIKCEACIGALTGNQANFLNSLISQKTHGGLSYPSQDVVKICLKAERCLRFYVNNLNKKNILLSLTNEIMSDCLDSKLFQDLDNHVLESPVNHTYFLIKSICTKYLNVRIHFIAKRQSQQVNPVRSQLTKLILFKGQ